MTRKSPFVYGEITLFLRWIPMLVLLAVVAGGVYYWLHGSEKPPEFTTTGITRGTITQTVTATGDLESVTSVDVSSQISGLVTEVLVDFNDRVKKGDVLARIDPATYDSKLKQVQAQLIDTKASYTLTKLNNDRTKALFARNLVSQQEVDQSNADLEQAEAQLAIQTANVENAQVDLSRCTIYSPIDGIVIDRETEVGKTVAASLNAPTLFTIVNDLSKMEIHAAVAEADVGSVAVGQRVSFSVDAFPTRQFQGTVAQIRNAPVIQSNVVTYATIIAVANDELKLKPGMTANVAIITAQRDDALKVPNSALRVRIPDTLLPAPPAGAAGNKTVAVAGGGPDAGAAQAGGQGGRRNGGPGGPGGGGGRNGGRGQLRQLMTDAGVDASGAALSPDAIDKVRKLAAERGITLPDNFGQARGAAADNPVVTRTVYKLAGTPDLPMVVPVSVKLGISDGVSTEVLDGLTEGDTLITYVTLAGAKPAATGPAASPFGGGGGGGFGGGGGGGGARRN